MTVAQRKALQDFLLVDDAGRRLRDLQEDLADLTGPFALKVATLNSKVTETGKDAMVALFEAFGVNSPD